jgi:hypothetical protein
VVTRRRQVDGIEFRRIRNLAAAFWRANPQSACGVLKIDPAWRVVLVDTVAEIGTSGSCNRGKISWMLF